MGVPEPSPASPRTHRAPKSVNVNVGRVTNEPQFEKVSGYIDVGKEEGERVIAEDLRDCQNSV